MIRLYSALYSDTLVVVESVLCLYIDSELYASDLSQIWTCQDLMMEISTQNPQIITRQRRVKIQGFWDPILVLSHCRVSH